MKHFIHSIKSLCACLLLASLVACMADGTPLREEEGTSTVRLSIPLLETNTRAVGTTEENTLHTLRVIILSQGAESINKLFKDVTPEQQLEITDVPVGQVQMYVIANEAAMGKDYSNLATLQQDVQLIEGHNKVIITDSNREYFPKQAVAAGGIRPIAETGLPMSWMNQALIINPPSADTSVQTVDVELERCVAKLNIMMNNALTEPITINYMEFGAFFSDRLCLFQEENLDVPGSTEYTTKSYENLNITIGKGESKQLVLYIYPSYAWKSEMTDSPYEIGFTTTNGKYPLKPFTENDYELNSIARNTQVNINATLSKPATVDLEFSVEPWTEYGSDVPPFN